MNENLENTEPNTKTTNQGLEKDTEQNTEHTQQDLTTLSREELIGIIKDLNEQIKALTTPPQNDWHALFYALLLIKTHRFPSVKVEREVRLGVQSPRVDFVVLKEDDIVDMELRIFSIFRRYNVLEFKNPDDELSEWVLWKTIGYATLYIAEHKISPNDVTITLFRGAKPVKLLKEMAEYIVPDEVTKGIYYVRNWKTDFPIQIVVTTELEGKEYAGFRAIAKKPDEEDIKTVLNEADKETDPEMISYYRDFYDMLVKLFRDVMEDVKRRIPDMVNNLMDFMKPEIEEKMADNARNIYFESVQDGAMPVKYAASKVGLSVAEFTTCMQKAGFKVPQMA